MKKTLFLSLGLTLALCAAPVFAAAEAESISESLSDDSAFPGFLDDAYDYIGCQAPDFTVETVDGENFTLSEVLAEKKAVLINFWATWCGPCRNEFPYLEEAYEEYQDDVAVIALSTDPDDSAEMITEYAEEMGLTFPMGSDSGAGLSDYFVREGIPTSVVIDRYGTIVLLEVGSQSSKDPFANLFNILVAEDYTESMLFEGFPAAKPDKPYAAPEELAAAMNAEGFDFVWENPEDEYVWPMLPGEENGRKFVLSTNAGKGASEASVSTTVKVETGEVFAFDFCTSTEAGMDLLRIDVDGNTAKYFGGEHDWTTYALSFAEGGEYEVSFTYQKDSMMDEGLDIVRISNARILSGEEADQAIAANPSNALPFAEEIAICAADEDAKEIVFSGSEEDMTMLEDYFLCNNYWIVPSGTAHLAATIDDSVDPEGAHMESQYDGSVAVISESADGDSYAFESSIDTIEETGYSYTCVWLVTDPDYSRMYGTMLFKDEENVNSFIEEMEAEGLNLSWSYADGRKASTEEKASGEEAGEAEYTAVFVDQNGDPVPGCIINFCTDESCVPVTADENGVAVFTGMPYAYHLQVIKVPEGYSFDKSREFYAEENGGEMEFTVTKD